MERSRKLHVELCARGFESQAKRLIDLAITLKNAGHLDIAEKLTT